MKRISILLLASLIAYPQDVSSLLNEIKSNNFQENYLQPDTSSQRLLPEQIEKFNEKEGNSKKNIKRSEYFGFDYINSLATELPSYTLLPVPNDYIVTFNDSLRIIFTGSRNQIVDVNVSLDGAILMPELGRIQAVGKTFDELKSTINSLVELSYVGVKVDLSLTNLSAKKISIIGAVKTPGMYLVNPFTTISSSLAYVDGLEDYASLRQIKLVKGNGEEFNFDLYDLLIRGDRSKDLVVSAGDTIIVGTTDNYVKIEGAVYREYIYEYLSNESFEDLIQHALGQTRNAEKDLVYIDYLDGDLVRTVSVKPRELIGEKLLNKLFIPKKTSSKLLDIKVNGNSIQDGYFSPAQFKNLSQLFSTLKLSDDFYPFFGYLKKDNQSTYESKIIVFNAKDRYGLETIKLEHNDEIFFLSYSDVKQFNDYKDYLKSENESEELENDQQLSDNLLSKVNRNEGISEIDMVAEENLPKAQSFDEAFFAEDLFDGEKAERFGEFYKNNLHFNVLNDNLMALNYGSNEIKYLPVGPNLVPSEVLSYLPYEELTNGIPLEAQISRSEQYSDASLNLPIPNPSGTSITIPSDSFEFYEVVVEGHVNSPGTYTVSKNTTLQELYETVGGFLDTADQSSIILQREKLKDREKEIAKKARQDILDTLVSSLSNVSTTDPPQIDSSLLAFYQETSNIDFFGRYSGDISNNSNAANNLIIEDGDYIFVPPKRNSISVIGQVQNQITVLYDETLDVKDYISYSGGYSEFADKKGIYIVSSNGLSRYASRKFFSNDEFFLSPGDTIVIPREFGKVKGVALASIAVSTLSNLAIAAASLNSISR